jgi:tRNA pseudouridine13 synthase
LPAQPTAARATTTRGIISRLYTSLPYATAALPGTGGELRATDDDFVVDELPAYPPSGAGDHVFARIEKRGVTTADAVRAIARALGVRDRDVGVAGLKDRHAVTRQWISLPPPVTPERVAAIDLRDVRVLEVARHAHKLRTGHLRGNRFALVVRGAHDVALARALLDELARPPGAPNWFGEQRFGRDRDNAERGRALLAGGPRGDRKLDRLMVSALQSELFNAWLAARMTDALYRRAILGDILHKRPAGQFSCDAPEVDTARLAAGEVVPTGPMFGADMRQPAAGTPAHEREAAILAAASLTAASWQPVRAIAPGTRRDAAIAVDDATVEACEHGLRVGFTLAAGGYATAVMRELMKPG